MAAGRKAADRVATRRTITGQDAVWIAIRAQGVGPDRRFDLDGLLAHMAAADWPRLCADRKTVRDYLRRLTAGGLLAATDDGAMVLIADPGPATPRYRPDGTPVRMGAGRRAIWRTIRMIGDFSLNDLVRLGCTEEVVIARSDAEHYVKWLLKAGYLMVVDRPANNAVPTTWRLLPSRNTGPLPPQIQRSHQVWDPNVGKVSWSQEAPECL
jgi:hypothetical protein